MEFEQFKSYFNSPVVVWASDERETQLFDTAIRGIYDDVNSERLTEKEARKYAEVFRKTSHMQFQIDNIQAQRIQHMATELLRKHK